MEQDLRDLRRDYSGHELRRAQLAADPAEQFHGWMCHALAQEIADGQAMTLCTADAQARPSARIVLLKHYSQNSYCWYTDRDSRKGQALAQNPQAELLFYWPQLHRQIRIWGAISLLPDTDNDAYFSARPEGSRFSAAASEQSRTVDSRASLELAVTTLKQQYPDGQVPRPKHWGGYRLDAQYYEFWQGRNDRLHDRFAYRLDNDSWNIQRLSP